MGTANYQYGGLTDWTINGSAGPQNFIDTGSYGNGATLPGTAQGVQAAFINGGDIYQDVGKLLANTTYTLTVAAGNQPGYGPGSTGAIGLVNGNTDGGTALSTFTSLAQPRSYEHLCRFHVHRDDRQQRHRRSDNCVEASPTNRLISTTFD